MTNDERVKLAFGELAALTTTPSHNFFVVAPARTKATRNLVTGWTIGSDARTVAPRLNKDGGITVRITLSDGFSKDFSADSFTTDIQRRDTNLVVPNADRLVQKHHDFEVFIKMIYDAVNRTRSRVLLTAQTLDPQGWAWRTDDLKTRLKNAVLIDPTLGLTRSPQRSRPARQAQPK